MGFPSELQKLILEGIVTSFVSISDFHVAGQLVDATNAEFEPTDPSFLMNGVTVEVEGPVIDGVLLATEVELEGW